MMVVACLLLSIDAVAVGGPVSIQITPRDVGLAGHVRPGAWNGLHAAVTNHTDGVLPIRCRWILPDPDGDIVAVERGTTLSPNQRHRVWLYAPVPAAWKVEIPWQFEVIDRKADKVLATLPFAPKARLDPLKRAVGVLGELDYGLKAYEQRITQHESCEVITGLEARFLPDRWYGFNAVETLVWSERGGSPDASDVRPDTRRALRHWVRRGGHLVVVMSSGANLWRRSTMASILPEVEHPVAVRLDSTPAWMGQPSPVGRELGVFQLVPKGDTEVLLRAAGSVEVGVACQVGFGRVTLLGIDLTQRHLLDAGLPSPVRSLPSAKTLWHAVFGWQAPIYTDTYLRGALERDLIVPASMQQLVSLDQAVITPNRLMARTAAGALAAAIAFFIVYGLVAGPLSFAWLRSRGSAHLAWLVFGVIVTIFSVISWGGALIVRPHRSQMEHFSVLDVYAADPTRPGEADVRVRSWMALLVARHGRANVAVRGTTPGGVEDAAHTLACFGSGARGTGSAFALAQRYTLRAGDPSAINLPVRSTAKQLRADFQGSATGPFHPREGQWRLPEGSVRLEHHGEQGWSLSGTLVHHLPGPLTNLRLVLNPGRGSSAVTWRLGLDRTWAPGELLNLTPPTTPVPMLALPRHQAYQQRKFRDEGFLGSLMEVHRRTAAGRREKITTGVEMLTFFSALPPPDFRDTAGVFSSPVYARRQGRLMDMSHLLPLRRLMLIGHLEDNTVPLPLEVDGRSLASRGWTTLRWICRLETR